jgi:hypothetical protein
VLEPEGELATPPPPPPCPVHGWACPRLGPVAPVEVEAEAAAPVSPSLPSPTPATASSSAGLGLRLPAPAAAFGDVFNNGAGSSAAAPAPTLSHRIRCVGSRSVLEASQADQRPGQAVRSSLSNGHSNGVAPGVHLPGGSSS